MITGSNPLDTVPDYMPILEYGVRFNWKVSTFWSSLYRKTFWVRFRIQGLANRVKVATSEKKEVQRLENDKKNTLEI